MGSEAMRGQAGIATDRGMRDSNEDFAACLLPGSARAPAGSGRPGLVAAVTDGVDGVKSGRIAAETTVRLFLDAQDDLIPTAFVPDPFRDRGRWYCA